FTLTNPSFTYLYILSLRDALPISTPAVGFAYYVDQVLSCIPISSITHPEPIFIIVNQDNQQIAAALAHTLRLHEIPVSLYPHETDRKSIRLNSSHVKISYAVF